MACAAAPQSAKASYDLYKDALHIGLIEEEFHVTGARYQVVSTSVPTPLLAAFLRTRLESKSSGNVTANGLRPEQYEYTRQDDASKNSSAAFDWARGQLRMSYESRSESAALAAGTQDRLSVMYQFMYLPAERLSDFAFQMTNGRKIEPYHYRLVGRERLDTPLGKIETLHLAKQRDPGENGTEVWLASEMNFFPVQLLIIENDGSRFQQTITRLEFK